MNDKITTIEQYLFAMKEDENWAPGWEAIDESLEKLYGEQEAEHYATSMISRALFGGDEYLDGYSFYKSPKGYKHLISYGMSELYAKEASFNEEFSKWGYEMTMKIVTTNGDNGIWAANMMGNLARYTFTSGKWFEENHFVVGDGSPLKTGSTSKLTSLIIVKDEELPPIDTIHGRVEFLQLVGVTWHEIQIIKDDVSKIKELITNMKKDNPNLVTNLDRTKNYL